jgi:hypothetical protein
MANYRDIALELVENGMVSAEELLTMALKYMSNDDVEDIIPLNAWNRSKKNWQHWVKRLLNFSNSTIPACMKQAMHMVHSHSVPAGTPLIQH